MTITKKQNKELISTEIWEKGQIVYDPELERFKEETRKKFQEVEKKERRRKQQNSISVIAMCNGKYVPWVYWLKK